VWVLYGGAEIVPEGMYNTYDAVSPSGHLAARYRKMIPACGEPWLPGQEPQVVDADGLRLGLCLCWEAWFPEIARTLTFLGADVILFPTGGLVHELGDRWRQVLAARAAENMVYTMASTNLLACEDGMAVINSPEGLVADARKQGIVYASVDIARLRYLRETDEELMVPKKYLSIPGLLRALPPQVAEHLQRAVTGFFEENR
jgi:predicted amidohydrolase